VDIIRQWDTVDTCFYLDPPYVLETRGRNRYYAVEPGDDYHRQLVDALLEVKGMAVLSGYDHPIYMRLADAGWYTDTSGQTTTMDINESLKGRVKERVEVVYRNARAADYAMRRPLWVGSGLTASSASSASSAPPVQPQ
jgi:DNA adenine methylase